MAVVSRRRYNIALGACLSSDTVGDIVYIRDLFTGTRYRVEKADPSTGSKMPAVAVILSKQSPTACVIQFNGSISLLYSGLTPGEVYFVGTDGRPAKTGDPTFPGSGYQKQQIGVAVDSSELLLSPMDVIGESGISGNRYYNQELVGIINGINDTFTTAFNFIHDGVNTEIVCTDGRRLHEGADNDYEALESGGVGTGYDSIKFRNPPREGTSLKIDFVPDI